MNRSDVSRWSRWIHVYLSMFSYAALLFFSVTGITLNHTGWIEGKEKLEESTGTLNPAWVAGDSIPDRLSVVEYFRDKYAIRARLADFRVDESECALSFRGPGFSADAFVSRPSGEYEIAVTRYGAVAVLNDLHKGRDTGGTWATVIDLSAIAMILVSVTGFVMIFFLRKWRFNGLILCGIGCALLVFIYYLYAA